VSGLDAQIELDEIKEGGENWWCASASPIRLPALRPIGKPVLRGLRQEIMECCREEFAAKLAAVTVWGR
jgi:hypothetical protein